MPVLILTTTLVGGGAEKQLLLTARGIVGLGGKCTVYVLRPVPTHRRYQCLFDSCRAAGVQFVIPNSSVGVVCVIVRLCLASLTGSKTVLWTWGFRAEALRVWLPLLWRPRRWVALRSASADEAIRHRRLLRRSLSRKSTYIANSEMGVEVMERACPGVKARSVVIYNAIESQFFEHHRAAVSVRKRHVYMLGNIRFAIKGYDLLLRVANRIRDGDLPIEFHVGGKQLPGEVSLQAEIEKAGLTNIVKWHGTIEDVRTFLSHADIFMLLSRYEGTPNALLEAMAMGIPCLSTNVGDLSKFAQLSKGLVVVSTPTEHAIILALRQMCTNYAGALSMADRGRKFCSEMFSEDAMLVNIGELLRRVGP